MINGLNLEKLRNILRLARENQKLTIEALASVLQCSPEEIRNFESGAESIQADIFFGLVNLLNLSPESVLPLIEQMGWKLASDSDIDNLISHRSPTRVKKS